MTDEERSKPSPLKRSSTKHSFAGKILLAMPSIDDPRFDQSVIYLCSHGEDGAMGLVINQVLPGIDMVELIEQLNIEKDMTHKADLLSMDVLSGGPVDSSRGFLLHSLDFNMKDTLIVNDNIGITGTIESLEAVATGDGPKDRLFILGYAGWSAGQLDAEVMAGGWFVVDARPDDVVGSEPEDLWRMVLGRQPGLLGHLAGYPDDPALN